MTTTVKNASRSDGFTADPEIFTIVTDPKHPLYDERVEAISENDPDFAALVASIAEIGVKKQIHVIRDGAELLVKDGNQRVRAARAANKLRSAMGMDNVQVPFKVVHEKNGESQLEKAGMNIHVRTPAMVQARLALKFEQMGKSPKQIATALGCTVPMVGNYMRLLDCAPAVQAAVEMGKASPSVARKLAEFPREEQEKHLETMLAEGVAKGSAGLQAVSAAKRGKKIEKKTAGRRMKNRVWAQEVYDRLEAKEGTLKKDAVAVLVFLRLILGYKGADKNQCDDVNEVLDEMEESKGAKGAKGVKKSGKKD